MSSNKQIFGTTLFVLLAAGTLFYLAPEMPKSG